MSQLLSLPCWLLFVQVLDCFLVYAVLTGAVQASISCQRGLLRCRLSCLINNVCLQFAYAFLLGSFPFNSFLAGMASCIGFFVLTGRCCKLPLVCSMALRTMTRACNPLQCVCACKSTPAIMILKADLQSGPLPTMFCAIAFFTSSSGTTWADSNCEFLSNFMTI